MSTMTEQTWTVAPEGYGAFSCDRCGYWFDKPQSDELANRHSTICSRCKVRRSVRHLNISVIAESARHLDAANVRDDLWYHSTTSDRWMEDLIAGEEQHRMFLMSYREVADATFMVHLGTVDAALDRARERTVDEPVYMYVVRLKDDAEITPVVKPDENDDCPVIAQDCADAGYSTEVTRYVNMFESPGSISLLANRTSFEIVDCIKLS